MLILFHPGVPSFSPVIEVFLIPCFFLIYTQFLRCSGLCTSLFCLFKDKSRCALRLLDRTLLPYPQFPLRRCISFPLPVYYPDATGPGFFRFRRRFSFLPIISSHPASVGFLLTKFRGPSRCLFVVSPFFPGSPIRPNLPDLRPSDEPFLGPRCYVTHHVDGAKRKEAVPQPDGRTGVLYVNFPLRQDSFLEGVWGVLFAESFFLTNLFQCDTS